MAALPSSETNSASTCCRPVSSIQTRANEGVAIENTSRKATHQEDRITHLGWQEANENVDRPSC